MERFPGDCEASGSDGGRVEGWKGGRVEGGRGTEVGVPSAEFGWTELVSTLYGAKPPLTRSSPAKACGISRV